MAQFISQQIKKGLTDKKATFTVPKKKVDMVDMQKFAVSYKASLEAYQYKAESLMNDDPKNHFKTDLSKSQIWNVQKVNESTLSGEAILNINKKSYYANFLMIYATGFDEEKFDPKKLLDSLANNVGDKKAQKYLPMKANLDNNLKRMEVLKKKIVLKKKNVVLLNIRYDGLPRKIFKLFESYLNSVQTFIAGDFSFKTRTVASSDTKQV